jgi:hypothetical protein
MPSLYDALERLGVASRQQLAEQLGISQASFSRLFQANRAEIVQIGRGRAVRYALRGRLASVVTPVPVWRVAADGRVAEWGELEALSQGRVVFQDQVFDDLPWLFWGMRPQGFMGRGFARRETTLGLPGDLNAWASEDILVALTQRGEDLPGDLLLGHESLDRYLRGGLTPTLFSRDDYPRLVQAALQGGLAGSSAGGEQPKFAVALAGVSCVIVKFSPPVDESPAARRWGDLLVCEHLALEVMRGHGQSAVESVLIEQAGRVLLETRRFDRTPSGHRAMVSGSALDMEFAGVGENWSRLAEVLLRDKRIAAQDAATVRLWDGFGAMIGNSDRHLGNLSFLTDDYRHFTLAPAYDMLPMRFAPSSQGEMFERNVELVPSLMDRRSFAQGADMAEDFWQQVRADPRLAGRMAGIAELSLEAIGRLKRQMGVLAFGRGG